MTFTTRIIGERGAFGWRESIASEAVIVTGDVSTIGAAYRFRSEVVRMMRRYNDTPDERREIEHRINEFLGRCWQRFNYVFYIG